jgi:hypothetical protein
LQQAELWLPCRCARRLDDNASELYGAGQKKGLLFYLPPEGTLLLNNIHKAPQAALCMLRATVERASKDSRWALLASGGVSALAPLVAATDGSAQVVFVGGCFSHPTKKRQPLRPPPLPRSSGAFPRVLLVSETALPQLADVCTVIKVPPLRVRPSDVRAMQAYFLRSVARQRDLPGIRLSDEAGGGRVDRERATQDGF